MNYRIGILSALLISASPQLPGQTRDPSNELSFVRYLLKAELFNDASSVLGDIHLCDSSGLSDSISFYRACVYDALDSAEQAAEQFARIPKSSSLQPKGLFGYAQCQAQNAVAGRNGQRMRQLLEVTSKLRQYTPRDSLSGEFLLLQQSVIALLQRDWKSFDSLKSGFGTRTGMLRKQQDRIVSLGEELRDDGNRHPLLAGVLSAMMPGLGRVYGGRPLQGIGSFLTVGFFSLIAYEGYTRDGGRGWQLYTSGSIAALLYAGEIYGSAVSVALDRLDRNANLDRTILLELRVPLGVFYR
jgi:TM2 domain-containing membrane protein YozV